MFALLEDEAGRTVQLRDDYALRAVDDERTALGHHRDFAEVELLLADVDDARLLIRRLPLAHDEPELRAQRHAVGHPLDLALLYRVLGVADVVLDELEKGVAVEIVDGERVIEDVLQPLGHPLIGQRQVLQEVLVRALLDLQ